jgi:hypothetical protein
MKKLILGLMVLLCVVLTASLAVAGGGCGGITEYAEAMGGICAISATFPVASTTTIANTYDTTTGGSTQTITTTLDTGTMNANNFVVSNSNFGEWRLAKEIFGRQLDFGVPSSGYMDSLQVVYGVGQAKAVGGGSASVNVVGGTTSVVGQFIGSAGK